MYTLDEIASKIPVLVLQKLKKPIPYNVIAEQLKLNGWIDEQIVDKLLKNSKQCVITIFDREYGPEAVVKGVPASDADEPSEFPGFYVAQNMDEVTITKELERAAAYIDMKYNSRLGKIKIPPISFNISKIDVNSSKKQATVEIVPQSLDHYQTERDYWENYVVPMLTAKPFDEGKAIHALAEAYEHQRNSRHLPHTESEAWARQMVLYSLYSLSEMMAQHARKEMQVKPYLTNQGKFMMDNLEFRVFYDPRIVDKLMNGETKVTTDLAELHKVA